MPRAHVNPLLAAISTRLEQDGYQTMLLERRILALHVQFLSDLFLVTFWDTMKTANKQEFENALLETVEDQF